MFRVCYLEYNQELRGVITKGKELSRINFVIIDFLNMFTKINLISIQTLSPNILKQIEETIIQDIESIHKTLNIVSTAYIVVYNLNFYHKKFN